MSHISSAYRLLTTCVYVHVRKGAREVLGKPVSGFQVQNYYIYFWRMQEMRVIASYCELAALDLHMLTYICVCLRKIEVSDGFRKNKTLKTKTTFLKTIAITIAIAMSKGSGWKPALSVTGDEVSG